MSLGQSSYTHEKVLTDLEQMSQSFLYATRKPVLQQAIRTIMHLEDELKKLKAYAHQRDIETAQAVLDRAAIEQVCSQENPPTSVVTQDQFFTLHPEPKERTAQFLIFNEVLAERTKQDEQWGGAKFDDNRGIVDWFRYIRIQMDKLSNGPRTSFRERFIKIAALAFAAIESYDRNSNKPK